MRFCKQADLERAVGSYAVLVELLDKNQDQVPDAELVLDVIDAGSNEIASYIELAVSLASLSEPYPFTLIAKSAQCAAKWAWARGTNGQSVPEHIKEGYEDAIRWAKDVGQRLATLGTVPKPALDPPAEEVDADPNGEAVSLTGFKRGGFR